MMQREEYRRTIEEERRMIFKYVHQNQLELETITDIVPEKLRVTLLRWIAAANITHDKKGQTEYGQRYTLIKKPESCVLHCEDGDLTL